MIRRNHCYYDNKNGCCNVNTSKLLFWAFMRNGGHVEGKVKTNPIARIAFVLESFTTIVLGTVTAEEQLLS